MKRLSIWTMVIACFFLLVTPLQAFAASSTVKVVVDGKEIKLAVAPYIEDNRVLVPVRGVFENLGLDVKWNQQTKTATITGGNSTIVMKLGQKNVNVNGKTVKIDTAVKLHKNSLFIPVRFVTENSGGNVKWNQQTKTVSLSKNTTANNHLDQQTKDLIAKIYQVQGKLNSYSTKVKLNQSMDFMGEKINSDMALDMDMVLNPLGMYQSMTMTLDELGETMTTKSYMTADGYYMYDSMTDQWMKFDDEMTSELQDLSNLQVDPSAQVELMARYYDNVKVIDKGSTYELHMSLSGKGYQEMLKEVLSLTDLGLEEDIFAELDMSINKMNIVSVVDKQTLYPLSGSMDSDITMVMEGEKMSMKQKAVYTYSNINKLDKIVVPKEVIDSAKPFEVSEVGIN